MVRVDAFSIFFHLVILLIALVVILSSFDYLEVQQIKAGEYYGLILFATVGMMLMSSAIELVLIFIALEISSISTYILAGFRRRAAESAEASLKYFLLGSFATAFFLYGVAMVFGATGSTNIYLIAEILKTHAVGADLSRRRADVCRAGVQSRLGSLPRLDSRRVRRLARAGCGIHVHRPESGCVRRAAARAVRHRRSGMVLDGLGLGRAVDVDWQHRRAGAEQRQAPAGLFLDRSRRISAGGFRGCANHGNLGGDVLCRFLRCHECGSVRHRRPSVGQGREVRDPRGLRRTGPPLPADRVDCSRSSCCR